MEKLEFYHPRNTSIMSIVAAAGMTGVSGLLIYLSRRPWWTIPWLGRLAPGYSLVAGIIGILFFGYGLVLLLYRMFTHKMICEVNEEGVYCHQSLFAPKKLIPYETMRKVQIQSHLGNRYISIDVHDEEEMLKDVPFVKRVALKTAKNRFGLGMVSIQLPGKSRKEYEEVVKLINQQRRKRS